jgi:hypothetical protein
MYKNLLLPDPTKLTQIWIFGLKIYHLATLMSYEMMRGKNLCEIIAAVAHEKWLLS